MRSMLGWLIGVLVFVGTARAASAEEEVRRYTPDPNRKILVPVGEAVDPSILGAGFGSRLEPYRSDADVPTLWPRVYANDGEGEGRGKWSRVPLKRYDSLLTIVSDRFEMAAMARGSYLFVSGSVEGSSSEEQYVAVYSVRLVDHVVRLNEASGEPAGDAPLVATALHYGWSYTVVIRCKSSAAAAQVQAGINGGVFSIEGSVGGRQTRGETEINVHATGLRPKTAAPVAISGAVDPQQLAAQFETSRSDLVPIFVEYMCVRPFEAELIKWPPPGQRGWLGRCSCTPHPQGGITIVQLAKTSTLYRHGVREGDRIIDVNGRALPADPQAFFDVAASTPAGSALKLGLQRQGGVEESITVWLDAEVSAFSEGWLGTRRAAPVGNGLQIAALYEASPAWQAGIRPGDVIVAAAILGHRRRAIRELSQFNEFWSECLLGDELTFYVLRDGKEVPLTATITPRPSPAGLVALAVNHAPTNAGEIALCDEALRREPANLMALAYRGLARVKSGKTEEGLRDLDLAVGRSPSELNPVLWRGLAYSHLQRWREAVRDLRTAAQLGDGQPGHWARMSVLGTALHESGESIMAMRAFAGALRSAPASQHADLEAKIGNAAATCLAPYRLEPAGWVMHRGGGLRVTQLGEQSLMHRAGVRTNDRIIQVNDTVLEKGQQVEQWHAELRKCRSGSTLVLVVVRGNEQDNGGAMRVVVAYP